MEEDRYAELQVWVRYGNAEMVREIMLDENWATEANFVTLVNAAIHGQAEIVRILLDHGVPPDYIPDEGHLDPVMAAAMINRADIVETLLEKGGRANPHHDSDFATPGINYAIAWGNAAMVKSFINHGATFDYGINPIDLARHFKREKIEEFLCSLDNDVISPVSDKNILEESIAELEPYILHFDFSGIEEYLQSLIADFSQDSIPC